MIRITIGSDHAGDSLKRALESHLSAQGHSITIVGSTGPERFDYPIASDLVAAAIKCGDADFGILVCGSGIGVSIRANRYSFVRAALCTTVEMAQLAREHNHANVLCLGERIMNQELALQVADKFLTTEPDRNERHVHRVELLGAELAIESC
ncbi:MAG: ribose 5-phosphate isomerase B [Fimbriimonadaceae bacterium]|nr:ribose 5-phosphate isomerase B [Fimbriimonadaceae bacterium]